MDAKYAYGITEEHVELRSFYEALSDSFPEAGGKSLEVRFGEISENYPETLPWMKDLYSMRCKTIFMINYHMEPLRAGCGGEEMKGFIFQQIGYDPKYSLSFAIDLYHLVTTFRY